MSSLNPFVAGALAAHEQAAKLQQLLSMLQQRELQGVTTRASILGQTEAGGQLDVPGLGRTAIPGLQRRQELENIGAEVRARATTKGTLDAQIDVQDKLSQKAIIDAKQRVKAAGFGEDSPDYNRQLAKLLGIQEELEIDIGGKKVKLPAKEAASILEKQAERATKLADSKELLKIKSEYDKQRDSINNSAKLHRAKVTAGNKPATAAENRAAGFFLRGHDAEGELGKLEDKIVELGLSGQTRLQYAPNVMQSEEGQLYNQAKRQFVEAYLRKDSGAQIAVEEFNKADKAYFVQPGDTPAVIVRKKAARLKILDAMRKEANRALSPTANATEDDDDVIDVSWDGSIPLVE